MVDTGIMNGADIVASIALGAKFTLIGRAYLYGLMAGGRQGVDRTIEILRSEIERTMKLLGVSSIAELEPRHVTQLTRLMPLAGAPAEAVAGGAPRVRVTSGTAARAPKSTANGKTDAAASRPARTTAAKGTGAKS